MLGAFPFHQEEYPAFIDRIKAYIIKSIREAKVHTAWLRPDTNYENAFTEFVDKVLEDSGENPFLKAFRPFQRKIQHYGIFNSLSQTLLKLTAPGVPDTYQGTELWDLSLVDPDNRRPVDFALRQSLLKSLIRQDQANAAKLMADLCANPEDGRIKLFLTYKALQARQHYPDLFQRGDYQKLPVLGSLQDHVVAFARHWNDKIAIVIVPRLLTHLVPEGDYPLGEKVWQETRISLPLSAATTWQNLITGQSVSGEDTLWIREVLTQFPVALLLGDWGSPDRNESVRSLSESTANEPTEEIE